MTATPGLVKWQVYDDGETAFIISAGNIRQADVIATVHRTYKHRAAMIAAAPEMLEALRKVVHCNDYCRISPTHDLRQDACVVTFEFKAILESVEAIITRATGRERGQYGKLR